MFQADFNAPEKRAVHLETSQCRYSYGFCSQVRKREAKEIGRWKKEGYLNPHSFCVSCPLTTQYRTIEDTLSEGQDIQNGTNGSHRCPYHCQSRSSAMLCSVGGVDALAFAAANTPSRRRVTQHQSFINNTRSNITCWGDHDARIDVLNGQAPWLDAPSRPLAAFCHESLAAMECGFEADPHKPYYSWVGFHTDGDWVFNVFGGPTNRIVKTEQYPGMLACYTKCMCSGQNPITLSGKYTDAVPDQVGILC